MSDNVRDRLARGTATAKTGRPEEKEEARLSLQGESIGTHAISLERSGNGRPDISG